MSTFTITFTFNGTTYTALETTDKAFARRVFNQFKALKMNPVCKWFHHESGITRIIE